MHGLVKVLIGEGCVVSTETRVMSGSQPVQRGKKGMESISTRGNCMFEALREGACCSEMKEGQCD